MHPFVKKMPVIRKVVKLKDLFLHQTTAIYTKLEAVERSLDAMMQNETSLLQGTIHTVETMQRQELEHRQTLKLLHDEIRAQGESLMNELRQAQEQLDGMHSQLELIQSQLREGGRQPSDTQHAIHPVGKASNKL